MVMEFRRFIAFVIDAFMAVMLLILSSVYYVIFFISWDLLILSLCSLNLKDVD